MAGILTNAQLRSKLPAGITLDSTTYPDASTALVAVVEFLTACEDAQIEQNATAPTGEDVQLISRGNGAETSVVIDGVTYNNVRLVSRAVTAYEQSTVTQVLPVLV